MLESGGRIASRVLTAKRQGSKTADRSLELVRNGAVTVGAQNFSSGACSVVFSV